MLRILFQLFPSLHGAVLAHRYSLTRCLYYLSVLKDCEDGKLRLALADYKGLVHHVIFRNEHYFL